jgi:HK97 family phage major capsid protein
MTTPQRPPKDGIRAMPPGSLQGDGKTLTGRLATGWAEIESVAEGHFMERFAPGAFRKTFTENRDNIKVLFQHGRDNSVGQQPIAVLEDVGEDAEGAYYRAELLDGVPPLILDGLRRGVYGSSHTFRVVREDWEPKPKGGAHNPKKLPERIVREALVWEFGPVTWPSYAGQTLARSMSDEFSLATLTDDPDHLRNLVNYIDPDAPSVGAEAEPHPEPERRETVATPTIPKKEPTPVDITQYRTRDEMSARRRELDAEITRMAELPGVLAEPDQADWDSKTEERTALDEAITKWDARLAVAARIAAEKPENTVAYTPPNVFARKSEADIYDLDTLLFRNAYRTAEDRSQAIRDNAMRAVDQMRFPHPDADQDSAKEDLAALVEYGDSRDQLAAKRILTTASPLYRRFFSKYVAQQPMTPEEQRAPLAVTADGTGGYAVPAQIDPTLIHTGAFTNVNAFRSICRVEKIVGTDTWQAVTAGAVTAAYATEAATTADSAPTLTSPAYETHRATCLVAYSIEIDQDWARLGTEMASLISEAKDTLEENQFTVGVGTTVYPLGVLAPHGTAGIYTPFHTASVDVCVAADLYTAESSLPIRHRRNAVWMGSRVWIRAMQALEVAGSLFDGMYYAKAGPIANRANGDTGLTLLGYPVFEAPSADTAITTTNTSAAVLFDPKSYIIVDRIGLNVEVIPHLFDGSTPSLPYGRRGLYALWRNTARPVNVDAGRIIDIQ